jgi:uncharacterized membrane protein YoaK (UPF0700 family)
MYVSWFIRLFTIPPAQITHSVFALLLTLISNVVQNAQFRAIVLEHVSAKPGTGNTASFANCSAFATDVSAFFPCLADYTDPNFQRPS